MSDTLNIQDIIRVISQFFYGQDELPEIVNQKYLETRLEEWLATQSDEFAREEAGEILADPELSIANEVTALLIPTLLNNDNFKVYETYSQMLANRLESELGVY